MPRTLVNAMQVKHTQFMVVVGKACFVVEKRCKALSLDLLSSF